MNILVMAGIAAGLAATPPTGLVHQVEVPHGGGSVQVSYHGEVTVRQKQVGMSLGPRPGTARCTWAADMRVVRHVKGGTTPELVRVVDAGEAASGTRHGDCMTVRGAIADQVASSGSRMQAALAEVASRDRTQLAADLDAHGHSLARLAR